MTPCDDIGLLKTTYLLT